MADNLIFPIGFDLEKAVEQAGKDWNSKYADKLEKLIAKRLVNVKLNLDTKNLDSLDAVKKRLAELKVEPITPETKTAIKELTSELRQLAKALETLQKYSKNPTKGAVDTSKVQLNEARAKAQAALAAQRTAKAEDNLAAARLKAARAANVHASATRNASKAYGEQSTYLDRLIKRMTVYWSIRQVGNFLANVREVTAEFELQRVSLGAIIQDQQRANQLFAEIKSFALTSPLKILDLTKYTKQVAAYGIETENLFDTTKMLADISVGLGVDMSRLTLFLGQVFATGYLRASEVRQATEAGIPLVDKLAQKLTETNGKLVSAADVMDLISKRAISFEMVEDVLKGMTSAGGMFYNMQVKQSQTLFGMWSKLGDAAAMMYDQIGNTEAVNTGMKSLIRFLELMMRNWKTTARVLDTVGMGLIVYVVGLKKAAIASQALSVSEAARLAITKSQVIMTPKLVAAIIGQNMATKLSTVLTKAHTVAMMKQAMATGILSRAFWSLSATLLANPWIAVAAAVAGATAALIHFTGNAETASERAEKLNNAVASFKTLEDTTGNLISEYNELIDKTERTASEQKKLSAVTQELAKQYPGAITAIGNFGEEVELAADKLNQLYQVEKQARMDNTRHELEKTEQKITETEERIARLQAQLHDGTKTITVGGGVAGYTHTVTVQMSDEDKDKVLKLIDELRYGKDGQSGLLGLQQSAEAARRALGLIPSEASQAVEKFGAWKKKLTEFKKDVGGINIRLFDEGTIEQFGTLDEALDAAAKKYKEATESLAQYDRTLNKGNIKKLTQDQIDKISAERDEAQAMKELSEEALKYYNAMALILKAISGDTQSDPRLGILQEMVSTLKQVNKEYDDLAKKEGATNALADTQKTYADTFKNMQALAKQYKFELPDFGVPTDTASLTKYLDAIKKAMAKLPKSDKAVLSLQVDTDKLNIDEKQKQIDEQLKVLADRVSRTKTAQEFYNKILSTTGDLDLAANVTMSIYGDVGSGLFDAIVSQIQETFKTGNTEVDAQIGIDLQGVIDTENERINYAELARIYDKYQDQIIAKNRNTAENIIKEGQKTAASNIAMWEKELAKAKDYEEQRTDIINRETQRRAEIYKSNLPQEEKDRLAAQSQRKQDEDLAKVNFEEFTKSEDYIKIFENLDNVATSSLKRLRAEMQALIDTNQNLSPENMKTLVKAMEDIDEQISGRGFGNDMIQSVNDYITSIRNLKIAKQELTAAEAKYQAQLPQLDENIALAEAEKVEAQRVLNELKNNELATKNQIVAAELRLNTATANVAKAEQAKAKAANKVKKAEQKVTDEQDKQKKATTKFFKDLQKVGQAADQLAGTLGDIKGFLGIAEDSAAGIVFDSAIEGLQQMSTLIGIVTAAQMLYNVVTESNPWMAIAAAVLAVISALSFGIGAAKVRKANKEIERQQNLLDQLEYTYGRLEKAADKVFGRDYLNNYNQQLKNLQAQQQAYLKQAEAERSKGKKKDKDKIKEYEEQARDTADKIKELQDELVAHFTGSSKTDVARQMAKSWIDARASMSDTFAAIKGDYQDLIKNMIVEGAAARVIENALTPVWDSMDKMLEKNDVQGAIDSLIGGMDSALSQANNGMEVLWKALEARGYDMKKLIGDTDSEYTGIAKSVAGATSEEINNVAAIGNTLLYYASPIPRIDENLARVVALMEGRGASAIPQTTSAGWTDWQQQAMDNYIAIQRNTADTVVECRRAAEACERIASTFKVKGSTKGLNVFLNS